MANPLDDLKSANGTYHAAANAIFMLEAPSVPAEELANVKAKFGSLHNRIFDAMQDAQNLLEPYFGGE